MAATLPEPGKTLYQVTKADHTWERWISDWEDLPAEEQLHWKAAGNVVVGLEARLRRLEVALREIDGLCMHKHQSYHLCARCKITKKVLAELHGIRE